MSTQTGNRGVDVVDCEHHAAQSQRVHRCIVRRATDRSRVVELRQLEAAVAIRRPHHRDIDSYVIDGVDAVDPGAFYCRGALGFHSELDKERDSRVEVVDDNAHMVHSLNRHDVPLLSYVPAYHLIMANERVDVEHSRTVRASAPAAFDYTLPIPLPEIFRRRFGIIPPIKEVKDQDGIWSHAGQTRTVVPVGGGSMREQLTAVSRPHSFDYVLTDLRGPMSLVASEARGQWVFTTVGAGTEITWRWSITPRSAASRLLMPIFTWSWRGYARRAMDGLADRLESGNTPDSPV